MKAEQDTVFRDRLSRHYDELKWLYCELYQDGEASFGDYVLLLEKFYTLRSGKREADPSCGEGTPQLPDITVIKDTLGAPARDWRGDRGLAHSDPQALHEVTAEMFRHADISRIVRIPRTLCGGHVSGAGGDFAGSHTILRILRMAAEIVCPDVFLLGDGAASGGISCFGTDEKPELHLLANDMAAAGIWHTVATQDVRLLKHQIERMAQAPRHGLFLNYLSRSDGIRWALDYEFLKQFSIGEDAHRKYLNDYYTGAWPDSTATGKLSGGGSDGWRRLAGCAADFCGLTAARRTEDRETLSRAVSWDTALHALLYTISGVAFAEKEPEIADAIGRLAALHAAHRVFCPAADVWLLETWNDHVLGVGRYYQGEKLLALFNFGDREEIAWIEEAEPYTDLLTDAFREAKAVNLPARAFAWLVTTF